MSISIPFKKQGLSGEGGSWPHRCCNGLMRLWGMRNHEPRPHRRRLSPVKVEHRPSSHWNRENLQHGSTCQTVQHMVTASRPVTLRSCTHFTALRDQSFCGGSIRAQKALSPSEAARALSIADSAQLLCTSRNADRGLITRRDTMSWPLGLWARVVRSAFRR